MTARPDLRALLLDEQGLVRAIATGRRRGLPAPHVAGRDVRRAEVRWVDLRSGPHLQVVTYDATQAHTTNHAAGPDAAETVDHLVAQSFAQWHVETPTTTHQVRISRKGEVVATSTPRGEVVQPERSHDRAKQRLLPADDPVLVALGISDHRGRIKPSRQAKYRQVEEFVRQLDAAVSDAQARGKLRRPTPEDPLRVVDLGCGNAYLTFAAHSLLSSKMPVHMIGVDVKQQSADHNARVAADLGIDAEFVVGTISDATLDRAPDVVLALHACDTATDDALARAVEWQAPLVLAAPCCHHDIAAQLRKATPPEPYAALVRDGILRERFADTLTDAIRASLLRGRGYRVDVVEFVESAHTPRNTLLRAVRTGAPEASDEPYAELVSQWGIRPRLAQLL